MVEGTSLTKLVKSSSRRNINKDREHEFFGDPCVVLILEPPPPLSLYFLHFSFSFFVIPTVSQTEAGFLRQALTQTWLTFPDSQVCCVFCRESKHPSSRHVLLLSSLIFGQFTFTFSCRRLLSRLRRDILEEGTINILQNN